MSDEHEDQDRADLETLLANWRAWKRAALEWTIRATLVLLLVGAALTLATKDLP